MSYVIAGGVCGILMASVFIPLGHLWLFFFVKASMIGSNPQKIGFSPLLLTTGIVVIGLPVWIIVGGALGVTYMAVESVTLGAGIGSPNLVFTLMICVASLLPTALLTLLLTRYIGWVLILSLSFTGIFGWLLPHMVSH